MLTEKIKELEAAKAKVLELEQKVTAERPQELASLPARYGFESVNAFIKAVRAAVASAPSRAHKARKAPPKPKVEKERKRARITDETRAKVKEMVTAGKSGVEIAAKLGISLQSLQNIKKAFGLVKSRGESAKPTQITSGS